MTNKQEAINNVLSAAGKDESYDLTEAELFQAGLCLPWQKPLTEAELDEFYNEQHPPF